MPFESPLLALPIALPLAAIAVLLCFRGFSEATRLAITVVTCTGMLIGAGMLVAATMEHGVLALHAGNWPAPLGITLVADLLSAAMILVTALIGFTVAIYSIGAGTAKFRGYFTPLFLALLLGVNGSFLTADLFNLYVWFEVMLMASFILVALPGGRAQLEAAVKYLTLNFVASAFFLVGLGILYGIAGTLNMADLAVKIGGLEEQGLVSSSAILFLIAFGVKAGIFPFYFWLPSSYHVTPTPVAAVFAGLLTKVGVYACMRVFTLVYAEQQDFLSAILLPLGILTMITGVLGAASQFFIPRILSFHIISQIGYMIVGLAFFTRGALAATVFYIVHHIIVKANLFLIGGIIGRRLGTQELTKTGGLYKYNPWLAVLFLIPAMSLGGIPPLSGFFAKFALVREGLSIEAWWTVGACLAVGILTLYSMIKIWNEAFWKTSPKGDPPPLAKVPVTMIAPPVLLAMCTLLFGIFPGVFIDFAERSADQLKDPSLYIERVMNIQANDSDPS
ncbi:MAG: proton-conducting transporter membrane subunit [Akkermansiaceae bacterium]